MNIKDVGRKEYKDYALEIDTKQISEQGEFKGFASTFGGQPDSYGDIIVPGAFLKSLSKGGRNGNGIVMLKHHDSRMVPGVWTNIMENKKGLLSEGKLLLETQLGKETYIEMKAGAIKGLSIGYKTIVDEWVHNKNKPSIRYIKEAELFEISIVAFPANTRATITSVKDVQDAIIFADNERELEQNLRDAGLSENAAKYIISLMDVDLRDVDPDEGKPFANEHACRLENPNKFSKFRRVNNAAKVNGKRIDHIIGITANGKSAIQSIRYPKSSWPVVSAAKSHCSSRGGSFEAAKEAILEVDWSDLLGSIQQETFKLTLSRELKNA